MTALLADAGTATEEIGAGRLAGAMLVTVVACLPLAITLWAFLDAARRPRWVWALTRHRQLPWMVGIIVGAVTVVGGLAISLWYLLVIRPRLGAVEKGELGPLAHPRSDAGGGP